MRFQSMGRRLVRGLGTSLDLKVRKSRGELKIL